MTAPVLALSPLARANALSWFKDDAVPEAPPRRPLDFTKPEQWQNSLSLTPEDKVTGYNNFYEFGLDKADPAANAGTLKTDPWKVTISGEVAKPLPSTLTISIARSRWKSAFIGCAVLKRGRW